MRHPKHASETNHVKGRKRPRELYLKKGSILGLPLLGAMDARKSLEERNIGFYIEGKKSGRKGIGPVPLP